MLIYALVRCERMHQGVDVTDHMETYGIVLPFCELAILNCDCCGLKIAPLYAIVIWRPAAFSNVDRHSGISNKNLLQGWTNMVNQILLKCVVCLFFRGRRRCETVSSFTVCVCCYLACASNNRQLIFFHCVDSVLAFFVV